MSKPFDRRPSPGLPEAVDPATGNGSAWETDDHGLALRLPDPLKALDAWLDISPPQPAAVPESEKAATPTRPSGDETPPQEAPKLPIDPASGKPSLPSAPSPREETPPLKKRKQKAGKRVRKAIETLQQQTHSDLPPSESFHSPTVSPVSPSGLSPFVAWLKKLTGSEYVHPYEEEDLTGLKAGEQPAVASETFADLLAAQGYKDRAIVMYEALMAKYPEKSSFFAAKIKALQ